MRISIFSPLLTQVAALTPIITDAQRDPFGAGMWAWYQGSLSAVIKVYSDVAVNDFIPVQHLFRTYSQMPVWEQRALDACRGSILDIGAGAGSHSLELQNRGLEVYAMDISPGAVKMMELRGIQHILHRSIWEYEDSTFDTLLMMMNGIGLVGDLKGLNLFLQKAAKLLRPGGQILLDSSDIFYLFEEEDSIEPHPVYYGIIQFQMSYKEVLGERFNWLYIDYERLQKHARLFGFSCEKIINGNHYEYLARLTISN